MKEVKQCDELLKTKSSFYKFITDLTPDQFESIDYHPSMTDLFSLEACPSS